MDDPQQYITFFELWELLCTAQDWGLNLVAEIQKLFPFFKYQTLPLAKWDHFPIC